jgi:pyruvate-formate lyase-activating enzyme
MKRNLNIIVSRGVRRVLRLALEQRARIMRQRFVCQALQGESEYNISINCDMTVSCNCQDDGTGILGNLDEDRFEENFLGPTAEAFRQSLARGRLPILTCARCAELRAVREGEEQPAPRLPYRGMLVENTIACNLSCPGCIRPEVARVRTKARMSLDDIRKVAGLLQRLRLEKLYFFNRGEPFLSPDILEEMTLIRSLNPDLHIRTSTNGMLLDTDEKRDAALLMDEVCFSIDGCDQTSLRTYQRGGDFARMTANLRALVRRREERGLSTPQIEWKYLLFNWNDRPSQMEKAIALARETGADVLSFWPTNAPFYGVSWRYRLGYMDRIGEKSWKGREVWFNRKGEAKTCVP